MTESAPFDVIVQNTSEVLTLDGDGDSSGAVEKALRPIPRGAVGLRAGRIAFLGPEAQLPRGAVGSETRIVDAVGGFVSPGLVDPHTHVVFAGERSGEFDLRCRGSTYLQIAEAGGGIQSTVKATREATEDELAALAIPRLDRLLRQGVTCAEAKSGYGLNVDDELKMLRAIRRLSISQPVELVSTLLCAHAIPADFRSARERYVALCSGEIVTAVAESGLADFCDAFVEDGAFTVSEARRILEAAKRCGITPRLHADQLSAGGGAELAAELGASSADHLEHVSDDGIRALAEAKVSAILVPTSTLFLRQRPYAPGRKLRDAGVNVALATNVNPGSSMTENVSLVMGLACLENGLSPAEAFWGFTRGAALALRREDLGRLAVDGPGDLVVFGCASYRHLPYHLAINHARVVIKGGKVVAENDGLGAALCR